MKGNSVHAITDATGYLAVVDGHTRRESILGSLLQLVETSAVARCCIAAAFTLVLSETLESMEGRSRARSAPVKPAAGAEGLSLESFTGAGMSRLCRANFFGTPFKLIGPQFALSVSAGAACGS